MINSIKILWKSRKILITKSRFSNASYILSTRTINVICIESSLELLLTNRSFSSTYFKSVLHITLWRSRRLFMQIKVSSTTVSFCHRIWGNGDFFSSCWNIPIANHKLKMCERMGIFLLIEPWWFYFPRTIEHTYFGFDIFFGGKCQPQFLTIS